MWFDKGWEELSPDEVVQIHIDCSNKAYTTDFAVISTIWRMESEARHAMAFEHSRIFLPVMACLAILDQVGKSYAVSTKAPYPDANASGIKKAAYYLLGFGANDLKTKTLYSFRNGVMHESSFTNTDTAGNHYWFRFDEGLADIVGPAQMPWDADVSSQAEENCSLVNPLNLLEATRGALETLRSSLADGTLRVVHPDGVEAIKSNYLLKLPRKLT